MHYTTKTKSKLTKSYLFLFLYLIFFYARTQSIYKSKKNGNLHKSSTQRERKSLARVRKINYCISLPNRNRKATQSGKKPGDSEPKMWQNAIDFFVGHFGLHSPNYANSNLGDRAKLLTPAKPSLPRDRLL